MVSLIFGIKHDADEHTYETVTDLHRKQTFREEEQGGEKVCEINRRRLLYIEREWISSRVLLHSTGFPGGSVGKESACSAGDLNLIPGLGRSPGEGKGCPLHYSGLKNSINCMVHGVEKSRTRLSDFHFHLTFAV